MTNLQLPYDLQITIKDYLFFTQQTRDEPEELQGFLKNISASLRLKVQVYVMTRVLKDNKVVQAVARNKLEATVEFMVSKMDLILSAPEDVLIKEGDSLESKLKRVIIYRERSYVFHRLRNMRGGITR
jgi:capsid protein